MARPEDWRSWGGTAMLAPIHWQHQSKSNAPNPFSGGHRQPVCSKKGKCTPCLRATGTLRAGTPPVCPTKVRRRLSQVCLTPCGARTGRGPVPAGREIHPMPAGAAATRKPMRRFRFGFLRYIVRSLMAPPELRPPGSQCRSSGCQASRCRGGPSGSSCRRQTKSRRGSRDSSHC